MVRKLTQDIFLDCALHQPFLGQKDQRFRIFMLILQEDG
jgi:hypothetical protein